MKLTSMLIMIAVFVTFMFAGSLFFTNIETSYDVTLDDTYGSDNYSEAISSLQSSVNQTKNDFINVPSFIPGSQQIEQAFDAFGTTVSGLKTLLTFTTTAEDVIQTAEGQSRETGIVIDPIWRNLLVFVIGVAVIGVIFALWRGVSV